MIPCVWRKKRPIAISAAQNLKLKIEKDIQKVDDEERGTMGKILDQNCAIFNFTKKNPHYFREIENQKKKCNFQFNEKKIGFGFF